MLTDGHCPAPSERSERRAVGIASKARATRFVGGFCDDVKANLGTVGWGSVDWGCTGRSPDLARNEGLG